MNTKLKLCFKGDRNYVQGPDIVSALLKEMESRLITNIDLKFNGIASTQLDLVDGDTNEQAKVNIRWFENGQERIYQLIENGKPIDCRFEYDEEQIIQRTKLDLDSQSIVLQQPTGYTLCENFVAMNKFLLQSLFPDVQGKWYFTRLEQNGLVIENALITVKLIKNFNFRLVKSDVLVENIVIGSIYFTMVKD